MSQQDLISHGKKSIISDDITLGSNVYINNIEDNISGNSSNKIRSD